MTPTNKLRFVERKDFTDDPANPVTRRVLQQWWEPDYPGSAWSGEWRDVPLEALENAEDQLAKPYSTDASKAITALRTALAQQAEPAQKPITRLFGTLPVHDAQQAEPTVPSDRADSHQPPGCDHCNHPLYAATRCRVCGRVTEQAEPFTPDAIRTTQTAWKMGYEARKAEEQAEPVAPVAEAATTQQQLADTPPSDYRRSYLDGYFDGFAIGKREGRIEAEDAAKQAEPVEPVARLNKKISFDEAMRLKDQMPKGLFRRVNGQAADEIWLCAIEVAERHHGITDPQIEDRLARHGIPMPGDPKC